MVLLRPHLVANHCHRHPLQFVVRPNASFFSLLTLSSAAGHHGHARPCCSCSCMLVSFHKTLPIVRLLSTRSRHKSDARILRSCAAESHHFRQLLPSSKKTLFIYSNCKSWHLFNRNWFFP